MKLSVIIPTYKFSKYIEQCVLSVLFQNTNFEFEVLVRDDFSNDGTNEILERLSIYYPNLKWFKSEENWGFHKNIKFLLEQASGEYISYIDGDDYYTDKDKLQKQIDFLDNNPEYIMHSTGYWRLLNDGSYIPEDPYERLWAVKSEVVTEDLFEDNYVGFGRMFRNIKGLIKEYFFDLPFFDYPLNYELSLLGKIKNSEWPSGVYREHGSGVLTSHSNEDKIKIHEELKLFLNKKHNRDKMKKVTIIDAFIHNDNVEVKLNNFLNKFRNDDNQVLLISNTVPTSDTIKNVDYYFYDKNNNLFTHHFDNVLDINLWKYYDKIKINETITGLQRHGLSVILNLFRSLKLAKSLGFTHFQRIEVDDLHGNDSINFINSVPDLCVESNKKGLFFFNENNNYKDISFHYFFCEIDYFLSIVKEIKCEKDYIDFIKENFNNNDFINVEQFIYTNILKNNVDDSLLRFDGSQMQKYFLDTRWNSETSQSNIPTIYEGVSTRLYRTNTKINDEIVYETGITILSYNYTDLKKNRKIIVTYNNGSVVEFNHEVQHKGYFVYNVLDNNISYIDVYEGERFMYREDNLNISSNILFE
jgi:glycosyltransferase involved in cell wall biosynthesis